MRFHGRLHPGRITDLSKPVELRIHQPRRCAGVTIKIWELDAYLGADGKPRREGTPDDLLATFTGDIEPAPSGTGRTAAWRTLKVATAVIEDAPPDALRFKLVFPGDPKVYEIPVLSEPAEVEGTEYELGFSIEIGGTEQFRTKSPCLLSIPRALGRVRELILLGFDENGEPIRDEAEEVPVTFDRLAFARPPAGATLDDATIDDKSPVLVTARVHSSGLVLADKPDKATPLGLNITRPLAAFALRDPNTPPEASLALATTVGKDGVIEIARPDRSFTASMVLASTSPTFETRGDHRHLSFQGDPFAEAAHGAPPIATRAIPPSRRPRQRR